MTKQLEERGGEADVINWQEIRSEYESTMLTMKALAEKFDVRPSTLRSRKNRENWQRNATENVATQKGSVATDKKGGQINNKNAVGNDGGAPKRNQNAVTHGFFSKYLPSETNDIFNELIESEPADIIWNNIMIQYTAIIRAQKIMFVTDKDEMIKEIKKEKSYENEIANSEEKEWEFQFSWDRHASFLNAQSRAMTTLSGLIKQFVTIADEQDERRLKIELMQGQIDKLKEGSSTLGKSEITIVDSWSDDHE